MVINAIKCLEALQPACHLKLIKEDKIKIFFDPLGRSVNLRFEKDIPNKSSLPVMRFIPEETSFSNPSCYCIEPCPPSGLMDISGYKGKGKGIIKWH